MTKQISAQETLRKVKTCVSCKFARLGHEWEIVCENLPYEEFDDECYEMADSICDLYVKKATTQ